MDRQNLKKAAEKYLESEKDEICCVYDRFAGFVDGAEWQFEQFEKNRLTACDNMTKEEAEREQRLVINFLAKNSRTPTFSDCIEITRREMIDKACKHINDHWDKLLVYDYNQYGGCVFNRQKTVEQFKQALEE